MKNKPQPDWESIEAEYRAGILSIPEITKRHGDGISHQAVYKMAKSKGWKRDLTRKVHTRTRQKLVAEAAEIKVAVAKPNVQPKEPPTDDEIVEAAADQQASVIRIHRTDIKHGRELVALLAGQLHDAATNREEIKGLIDAECTNHEGKIDYQKRQRMLKAISLPSHGCVIRDLSTALKNLITLERQAFNIGSDSGFNGQIDEIEIIFKKSKDEN